MSTLTDPFPKHLLSRGVRLPDPALDALPPVIVDTPPTPADAVDAAVEQNRATQNPAVVDQRRTPRLSIHELNQSDPEDIARRLSAYKRDDRSPVTQLLDLIDLPRNAVAGFLAPALRAKAAERGETGTFGLGKVTGADLLDSLGVENRVIKGLGGFGLDLAFDPLTYIGPAGWGAQLAGKGGTIALRGAGKRALRRGIESVSRGTEAADAAVGAYLKARGLTRGATETVKQARDRIAREVYGDVSSGTLGRVFSKVGGDINRKGGSLVEDFFSTAGATGFTDAQKAAAEIVKKYGRGTGGIGPQGGSGLLHVPFTDIEARVPAFTPGAKSARRALMIANARESGLTGAASRWRSGLQTLDSMNRLDQINSEMLDLSDAATAQRSVFDDEERAARNAGPSPNETDIADRRSAYEASVAADQARLANDAQAAHDVAVESLKTIDPVAASKDIRNVNDLLAQSEAVRTAETQLESARARLAKAEIAKTINLDPSSADFNIDQVGEDLYDLAKSDPATLERVTDLMRLQVQTAAAHAEALRGPIRSFLSGDEKAMLDFAKSSLGTGDDDIAHSAFRTIGDGLAHIPGVGRKAADAAYAVDRSIRRTFGVRGGHLEKELTRALSEYRHSTMRGMQERERVEKAIASVLGQADTPANREAAQRLVYLMAHEEMDPNKTGFYWWKFGEDGPVSAPDGSLSNPSAMAQEIKSLAQNGVFTPERMAELRKLATEQNALWSDLRKAEQSDRLLGAAKEFYGPLEQTPESQDATRAFRAAHPELSNPHGGSGPEFSRHRMYDQTRYIDPDTGKWARFFEADRASAAQLKVVERYDELAKADPAFAQQYRPHPTDAVEMNDLYKEGRFDFITGGDRAALKFFADDIGRVTEARLASHERAVARASLNKIVGGQAWWADPKAIAGAATAGETITMKDGNKLTSLGYTKSSLGKDVNTFQIGNEKYRLLDPDIRADLENPFVAQFGDDIHGALIQSDLADKIEDIAVRLKPENVAPIVKTLDSLTGIWKMQALFHPSWPVFNMIGNTFLALAGGARPQDLARNGKELLYIRMNANNPAKLAGRVMTIGGQDIPFNELAKVMSDQRIFNNNLSLEAAGQYAKKDPGILAGTDRLMRRYLGPWFRTNQIVDDWMRGLAFASFLEQGYDQTTAARRAIDSMLDFADLTSTEERFFRRLMPFYSWTRSNLGYQLHMLMQRPSLAALGPKLKEAIEQTIVGEDAVPDNMRPGWMRDSLAAQIGSDPNSRFALTLGSSFLPTSDLFSALTPIVGVDGAQKFLHYFASNLSPVLTTPLEIGTGHEFFSGRSIAPDFTQGDLSVGEALSNKIRPVAEFAPGGRTYEAFGRGPAQGLARLALAGRAQAFDQQRLDTSLRRELREEEDRLRSAVRRAERKGDKERSAQARTMLLGLYREMLKKGLDDAVPAWAEQELEQFSAGTAATTAP